MPIPSDDTRIRLVKTAFVIYKHADLAVARRFLLDFGLQITHEIPNEEICFSGYGTEPIVYVARNGKGSSSFGGAAYEVESRTELERASSTIPGAGPVAPLPPHIPGGGEIVTLRDPAGHLVHLVHGQTPKQASPPALEKLTINYEDEKPRKGAFQRFTPGPAMVHKWGHYGVTYPEGMYQQMYDWYTQNLALAPSDIVHGGTDGTGNPITCFFHIDRGLEYTDHHAFFFKRAKPGEVVKVAHAAFEVHDFDVQQLGHQYLESKGYELCWGVGRVSPHYLQTQQREIHFKIELFTNIALSLCSTSSAAKSSTTGLTPASLLW